MHWINIVKLFGAMTIHEGYGGCKGRNVGLPLYLLDELPPLLRSLLYSLHMLLNYFHKRACAEAGNQCFQKRHCMIEMNDICNWKGKFIREQSIDRDEARSFPVTSDNQAGFRVSKPNTPGGV